MEKVALKQRQAEEWNVDLVRRQHVVAAFFGATSGIGHKTVRALADAAAACDGEGIRAYIVGRDRRAGEDVREECRRVFPRGDWRFIECADLALLASVDLACAEIAHAESKEGGEDGSARIDYLMMSQGGAVLRPRKDTKEGLDAAMSLLYYSRMRITQNFMPLLTKSRVPATVVSVYAGGMEGKLVEKDLSLRSWRHYSPSQVRSHVCYMTTAYFETLARRNRGDIRLIHIFPGLADDPGPQKSEYPAALRFVFLKLLVPLFGRWMPVPRDPPSDNGVRMLALTSPLYPPRPATYAFDHGLSGYDDDDDEGDDGFPAPPLGTDGRRGSGAYTLDLQGKDKTNREIYGPMSEVARINLRQKMCQHTDEAFEVIQSGRVFKA